MSGKFDNIKMTDTLWFQIIISIYLLLTWLIILCTCFEMTIFGKKSIMSGVGFEPTLSYENQSLNLAP